MPGEHRVTIRIPESLYTQLAARGSHGQPLAAIIREALEDYLMRQPGQPPAASTPTTTVAAMAARIEDLARQVQQLAARLDTLAAEWQPPAASEEARQPAPPRARTRQPRQPDGSQTADSG